MIKNLRLSVHMLKFAYGIKSNLIFGIIIIMIGFFIEIMSRGTNWIGIFFMLTVPMFGVQFLYSSSLSNLVLSSPYRKRLQTTLPTMMGFIANFVLFTVLVFTRLIWIKMYPQEEEQIMLCLLIAAIASVMFFVYTGLAYKYFIVSMIIVVAISTMGGGFMGYTGAIGGVETEVFAGWWILKPIIAIPVTYILIFAGAGLQYIVSLAIHKKPLSKRAQGASMKRYL